jgi:hypothetical protein
MGILCRERIYRHASVNLRGEMDGCCAGGESKASVKMPEERCGFWAEWDGVRGAKIFRGNSLPHKRALPGGKPETANTFYGVD